MSGTGVPAATLREFALFGAAEPGALGELAARTRVLEVESGQLLFRQGEPARGLFCVASGLVKLSLTSAAGVEKVVEVIGAGHQFAEAVVFSGAPYPVDAVALAPGRLLLCPAAAVLELIEAHPPFARSLLVGLSRRLHGLVADVEAYTLLSSTQRVVAWLLAQRPPGLADTAGYPVRLATTKAVLASRIGVAPETLSRVLASLSRAGTVVVTGRRITVSSGRALLAVLDG